MPGQVFVSSTIAWNLMSIHWLLPVIIVYDYALVYDIFIE